MPRLALGICLSIVCLAPAAAAQPAGNLPIDTFRPAIDSRGYLTLNGSQPLGHGELSFGLGALSWGRNLLALEAGASRYSVDDVVTATLGAAVGLHLGPAELELGASLPLSILSGDRGPDAPAMPGNPNGARDYKVSGQGIGSAGLHLKARLLGPGNPTRIGAALIASLYLPTASRDSFLGDGRSVPQLVGVVDRAFAGGRLRLAANGGVRLRSPTAFTDAGDMGAPPTNQTIEAGTEAPFGLGAAWALAPGRFDLVGEVYGAVPLGSHQNYQPLEALGGVKLYLARNSYLSLGAGRGLLPARGANPDARAFIGIVFEPKARERAAAIPDAPEREVPRGDTVADRDGDGIPDTIDRCPDDPEDFDGFEDEDGCPDLDNDGDRIPDTDDLCPDAPEDYNGFEDEDGCPDQDGDKDRISDRLSDLVVNKKTTLEILRPIMFEYDKDIIKKSSYYILDAVVAALQRDTDIQLLEIAGHTDEQGDDAYNLDLSIRRAAAVKRYLTEKGVDPRRLESQGYGETQPLDPRHTQAAYAKNRRVEFLVLKRRSP